MKLFVKYNRLNISATIITFIIGSCTFYFLLHYILINQIDESLQTERQEVIEYVKEYNKLPEILPTNDQYISYSKTTALQPTTFSYINGIDDGDNDQNRKISFGVVAGGIYYLVAVMKPLEQTEELLKIIIWVTIGMIGIILITSYFINRSVLSRVWGPFYLTVDNVKKYDLSSLTRLKLEKTDIDEFNLLNESINSMTERVQQDYRSLKEFTSHAAHEMQTPLAVIRTRLDLLIQNEMLLQHGHQQLYDIEKAVHKLSRLYQSLLLLTKVENRQFILNEAVDLEKVIMDKSAEFAEMTDAKKLDVKIVTEPLMLQFHQHLAEIIVSNLFNNAIRYNKPNGTIAILLKDGNLSIANTSSLPELDKEQIFHRFYRHSEVKEEGNGLGLSIVKEICDLGGYKIDYRYADGRHIFSIAFH